MKKFLFGLILTVMTISGSYLAKAEDCFWDGYQLGAMEADNFCDMWERMYNDDIVVMPYSAHSKLCEYELVSACKHAMAQQARENYPLCTWLVRSGWRNSYGQSATQAWATWQRNACNVYIP